MYGTYCRLGVHVWAPDCAVIRAASRKLKRVARHSRKYRQERHAFYRRMLDCHRAEQTLCMEFRL